MVNIPIDNTRLLVPESEDTEFYNTWLRAISTVADGVVHSPREALARLRFSPVDAYYGSLNAQMLGLKVPLLSFTEAEYSRLMRWLGIFVQTRGASTQFINFLSFIKNVPIEYIPLWATDLDDIATLTETPDTSILDGGDYFPTPFYDVYYSLDFAPDVTTDDIKILLGAVAPIHLVLRNVVAIEQYSTSDMIVPIALDYIHDVSAAAEV